MKHDKIKIKEVMLDYLTSNGWPNMLDPDVFIMNNLKAMFLVLLSKGLVRREDWPAYVLAAENKYIQAQDGV